MSQLQELARCLTASGGTKIADDAGMHLLYVENSNLISKHWNGKSFDIQELVATSILPGSPAIYLATSTEKRIIAISSSSSLRALVYDEDGEEWVDDEAFGEHKVHPKGKITGWLSPEEQPRVLFQDSSKQLVHLDSQWNRTVLPVKAVEGSPLSTSGADGRLNLFYVSASDNDVHYATQQEDGSWRDALFLKNTLDANEKPSRFLVSQDASGAFELFVLTEGKALLEISANGKKTGLGTVSDTGEWVPNTKEECVMMIHMWAHMHHMHQMHGGCRRMCW